ncbi:MAG TPA: DoxX family protein [Nocardioides sp.]|nr:DoxX family protein [Nocardioides sp.]
MTTTAIQPTASASVTGRHVVAGRVVTGALSAFLVVDAGGKLLRTGPSVEGTHALGFADAHVVLIGALLAAGLALHLVPRTAFVGAVYLTAYFGGAVAAHVRQDNVGSVVFTVLFAVAVWVGYVLREPRVRHLVLG